MNLRTLAVFAFTLAAAGRMSAEALIFQSNIPFSFVVNGRTLPAGEYSVRQPNSTITESFVRIQGTAQKVGALVMAVPTTAAPKMESAPARPGMARLVFHRYGDQYFLFQIWTADDRGEQIPQTRQEREIAAHRTAPHESVAVALR